MEPSAVVLGATGLVGKSLVKLLAEGTKYQTIKALVRRPLNLPAAMNQRVTEVVCDFDRPETYTSHLAVSEVFCCLGTTIKVAGSKEAFRKVDHDYPLALARAALAKGASRFLIVTAVGADPQSPIFYNQVKGELEKALAALPFARGVAILRPSMLLGERTEKRPLEQLTGSFMKATAGLFAGPLLRYRAIDASDVALALVRAAEAPPSQNPQIYEGQSLFALLR